MKKLTAGIFTVLMGLVSVNAADAAVASKGYVDQFVGENGSITTKVGALETTVGDAESGLVKDVADLQSQLANGELKINNDAILTDMIKDGQVTEAKLSTELAGKINAKADTSYVNGELDKKVNKADAKLDQVGADGSYIKLVSQADGKVSASAEAFVAEINESTKDSGNAPSVAAVTGYITEELAVVTGQDGISGLKTAVQNLNNSKADKATTLAGYGIADAYTKTEVDGYIDDATKAGTDASAALAEYKTANDAKVNKNAEDIAAMDAAYKLADTNLETSLKGYADQAEADAISAAGTAADGKITAAVEALDVTEVTATDGNYFNAYAETDGKISMQQKTFETALADGVKNAPQTGAVKSYVDTKVSGEIAKLNLNELSRVPAECGVPGKYCVLTSDGNNFLWEVIERGADESQPAGQPIPSVQQ